jgi:integrase
MRQLHKLKGTAVNTRKPGMYSDGGGLWLQVGDGAKRSWIFRYKASNGKERYMGLGPAHTLTLADARAEAEKWRRVRLSGGDPIEARKTDRAAVALSLSQGTTFKEAAEQLGASIASGWRNAKHQKQWLRSLEIYAYPVLAKLPVQGITTDHVLRVLEPIWKAKPTTADRVRSRIEAVWDSFKARNQEMRLGECPARWRGHLDHILPASGKVRKVKHHPAMPYQQLGAFVARLRAEDRLTATALEMAILCASRLQEVAAMRWSEINLAERVWIIPGERMKGGAEHRVALSDRAVAILKAREATSADAPVDALVFPGTKGRPLSNSAFKKLRQDMGIGEFTSHGFRSSFKSWAAECTAYPDELSEAALAHISADKVLIAYRRTDFFDKRRALMQDWADYCDRITPTDAKVIPIRSAV